MRWIPFAFGAAALTAFGAGIYTALSSGTPAPARPGKISRAVYALAEKWAAARGLPLQWVLATILVESGGDVRKVGDCYDKSGNRLPECKSLGLMQVNWVAHGERLRRDRLAQNREDLFDPETNIKIGTLFLREAYDLVLRELAGTTPNTPIDLLTRFAYKGPAPTKQAIRQNEAPQNARKQDGSLLFPDGATVVARWSRALANTTNVV